MRLLVHTNNGALAAGVNPFTHGSSYYTDQMKTEALRQALDAHGFDVIFGGARRDEESVAREGTHLLVPIRGPSLESEGAAPGALVDLQHAPPAGRNDARLSAVELDRARHLALHREREHSDRPLYFAEERPVVNRAGTMLMLDDDRFPLAPGEQPERRFVRFRTLGCYPLSGAIESRATTVAEIIAETVAAASSERQGRLIDTDQPASMEKKKREGYF